jgi:hypothetical protein
MPPIPVGAARRQAIYDHYCSTLMLEECNDPKWDPDNNIHGSPSPPVLTVLLLPPPSSRR